MLIELRLTDFGLVDSLTFEPGRGLVAVTGETGAGKSLLVNALAFVTGDRAPSEWIRSGSERCDVTAVFEPHDLSGFAEWIEGDETMLVLRRELSASGRSRAWINLRPVPVAVLKRAGSLLCDLHGQHQHQWLLQSEHHADYLDRFVPPERVSRYRSDFELWRESQAALMKHRQRLESDLKQKGFWEFQKQEFDRIQPRSGEYEQLESARVRLRGEGDRSRLVQTVTSELDGTDDSLLPRVSRLVKELEAGASTLPGLSLTVSLLHQVQVLLGEAASTLSRLPEAEGESESSLDTIEQRLHALYSLKKKFGGSLEAAIAERDRITERLQYLEWGEGLSQELTQSLDRAASNLKETGSALIEAREKAAGLMKRALRLPLSDLGLGTDPLSVMQSSLELEDWTESGPSRVEFMLQANPGEAPKSLAKIASGGELSRIMLGLKSVLPGNLRVSTLVFDEIDAGIGGETAVSVGKKLESLAQGRQVIVITHLHQIAARAAQHVEVRKRKRGGRHVPEVRVLDVTERKAALARLIAGDRPPDAARAAAEAILQAGRSD